MKRAYKNAFLLRAVVSAVDWMAFNSALFLTLYIGIQPVMTLKRWLIFNISYVIAHLLVLITLHKRWSTLATIMRNASRSSLLILIFNAAILGMSHLWVPGFFRTALMWLAIFLITVVERMLLRRAIKNVRYSGRNSINAVIIGGGDNVGSVINVMNDRWNGYRLLGFFGESKPEPCPDETDGSDGNMVDVPYLGKIGGFRKWAEGHEVDEVYICLGSEHDEELVAILKICAYKMIRVYYIPRKVSYMRHKGKMLYLGDTLVMAQYKEPLMNVWNRLLKRAFDIAFSLLFMCTLFPIIYLIVFLVTKITMPGPVLFKQKRTGYDGRDFYCYKFRSMKVNSDSDKVQATQDDPRVTAWGRIMRHTSIDELPQFINVLKGDMSVVGPRPHMLAHTEYYGNRIGEYMIRHYVRPGITGWAQTHGERGETRTVDDMARRVERDIWYIEHWSFWLDVQIILKTVCNAVAGDKKAY